MLKKFKGILFLLLVLLIAITICGIVSAHEGDMPPEISIISPQNNKNLSGEVNLAISLDHSHTGLPDKVNITITGQNVNYNKKIQLTGSNFDSINQCWQSTWDTSDATNGKYAITAECSDIYGKGSSTIYVNVNNVQKSTKIELNNFKGVNNQEIIITATLRDSSNQAISGKNLQFNVGGKIYTATTNTGGIAKITHREGTGNYTINVKFSPDSNYASSEKTSTLTISSSGTIVKVTSVSVDKSKIAQLKATLTNSENDQLLTGRFVRFTVNGVYVGVNTTNKNGIAVFNYKVPLNGGKYTILATASDSMSGSEILRVRQSSMYLKISADNTSPLVGNKFTLYYRLINDGPDTGKNTVFTYKIPKGFDFLKASKNAGTYKYNSKTKAITWKLPSAKIGTSLLKITVKMTNSGTFLLKPKITTDTYDNSLKNSLSNIYLRTNADLTITKVKRSGNIYKVTIKNEGGRVSKTTSLKIYYTVGKKIIQKTYKIKGIDATKSLTINAKFFKYSKHKKYTKIAHINYNKKSEESNYKNNKKKFKV